MNDMYQLAAECEELQLEFGIESEWVEVLTDRPRVRYSWKINSGIKQEISSCTGFETLGWCLQDYYDRVKIIREAREENNPLP